GWRDPRRHEAALRIAVGHLARHHPRDTDAAHTHHRPNGERLSRRQAVAVLRLAPFTERGIRTAVNTTVRLIETAPTKVPPPASRRLPERSKERPVAKGRVTGRPTTYFWDSKLADHTWPQSGSA